MFGGKNEFVVTKKKKTVTKRKTKEQAYGVVGEKLAGCVERIKTIAELQVEAGNKKAKQIVELAQEALDDFNFLAQLGDGDDPLGDMTKKELLAFTDKQKERMKQFKLQVAS